MKIQINSLEALERLIAGDTELEIQVRQSVAEELAKKHLKSLFNSEITKAMDVEALRFLAEEVFAVQAWSYKQDSYVLRQPYRDALLDMIRNNINVSISGIFAEQYREATAKIESTIHKAAERVLQVLTDENINKRIDELVEARIKQRLGLK